MKTAAHIRGYAAVKDTTHSTPFLYPIYEEKGELIFKNVAVTLEEIEKAGYQFFILTDKPTVFPDGARAIAVSPYPIMLEIGWLLRLSEKVWAIRLFSGETVWVDLVSYLKAGWHFVPISSDEVYSLYKQASALDTKVNVLRGLFEKMTDCRTLEELKTVMYAMCDVFEGMAPCKNRMLFNRLGSEIGDLLNESGYEPNNEDRVF